MGTWVTSTFWLLWIILINKTVQMSVQISALPRSRIAVSYGNSLFNFLWFLILITEFSIEVFYRSCTILHSHQQCKRVPIFLFVCLFFSLLMAMKWYLTVVLVCIFLLITDVEYLFMWLLAICISYLNKWVLKFFIFKLSCLGFLLSCRRSLYILDINRSLISYMVSKYFLPSHRLPFHSVSFDVQKFLMKFKFFVACAICNISKLSLPNPRSWRFSSKSILLALKYRFLIHFKVTLKYLEKGMATHSSILARRIPWTGEPGGLQSVGLPRVRHNWATNALRYGVR